MSFSRFPRTLSWASRSFSLSSSLVISIGRSAIGGLADERLLWRETEPTEDGRLRWEPTEDGRLPGCSRCCCLLVGRLVAPPLVRPRMRVPPIPERFSCSRSPGTVVWGLWTVGTENVPRGLRGLRWSGVMARSAAMVAALAAQARSYGGRPKTTWCPGKSQSLARRKNLAARRDRVMPRAGPRGPYKT